MVKRPLINATTRGAQPSQQPPSTGHQPPPEVEPKENPPINIRKLVRKMTKKVKPSKGEEKSNSAEEDPAEEMLAGFMSRNPQLYGPADEKQKQASLEIPEPVMRAKSMSKSQREWERLENPLILDPEPEKQVEERRRARETMRQSRTARFRRRLEEYF